MLGRDQSLMLGMNDDAYCIMCLFAKDLIPNSKIEKSVRAKVRGRGPARGASNTWKQKMASMRRRARAWREPSDLTYKIVSVTLY